jgi:hypothetical protein
MRLYGAICEYFEALAARARAETLEAEFENADWAEAQANGWDDDD